jgi:hypothetical protein
LGRRSLIHLPHAGCERATRGDKHSVAHHLRRRQRMILTFDGA